MYTAAVFITYYKVKLKLLDVMLKCSKRLHDKSTPFEGTNTFKALQKESQGVADDIAASVPFHLVANLDETLQNIKTKNPGDIRPQKALGGLFLMYPLYIAATLPPIPSSQQEWMKARLIWIGKHMGIGEAVILANVSNSILVTWALTVLINTPQSGMSILHETIKDGHTLVFAGSLIQPYCGP